MTTDHKFNR